MRVLFHRKDAESAKFRKGSYLRLTNKRLSFLINFNVPLLKHGFEDLYTTYNTTTFLALLSVPCVLAVNAFLSAVSQEHSACN